MTTFPLSPIAAAADNASAAAAARPAASPAAGADADRRLARRYARLALTLCFAAHVWLVSAGLWAYWPQYTARCDLLARAFAAGQTHLLINADPRHLALPDPYDPVANHDYRQVPGVPDSCLYDGKFYLYWGPVPALLLTPARWVLPADIRIGDQFLTFAFVQGMMLATAGLLLRLRAEHFLKSPAWVPAIGLAVAGLSAPITCVLTRAAVYEVAIVGGQCFLLTGVLLAWRAVGQRRLADDVAAGCHGSRDSETCAGIEGRSTRRDPPDARHRSRSPATCGTLTLSGTCLALAVGCRVSLAVAVTAIGLLVCGRLAWDRRHRLATAVAPLLAFGLPLAAGAVALAAYNYARFGSPLEFGQRYQLAGVNLRSYPSLFGAANLWPGLWSYFLRPVAPVGQFPFLLMVPGGGTFPAFIHLPEHYESYERIGGLLWTMPVLWLIPAGAVGLWAGRRRRAGGAFASNDRTRPTSPPRYAGGGPGRGFFSPWMHDGRRATRDRSSAASPGDLRWAMAVLAAAAVLGFAPVLLMIGSSQRYLADLTPPLVPVLVVVACRLADPARGTPRAARRWLAATASLAGATAALGALLAVEGYAGHFRFQNPELFEQLSGPAPAGMVDGPATGSPSASVGPDALPRSG